MQSNARGGFLTAAEVAAILRVSTMTVYRLIKAGQLAAVRVGKSYRVREDDVDRYLARTSWAGTWWVTSITVAPGAIARITALTTPTNSSASP